MLTKLTDFNNPAMRYAALLLFLISTAVLPAQNTAAKIAAINAQAAKTDSALDTYYTKVIDNNYFDKVTDNGIEITGYFNVRTLEKVTEKVVLSSCTITCNYYLKDGKPALIHIRGNDWVYDKKKQAFTPDSTQLVMDYKYYFEDYQLLQLTGSGGSRCNGKPTKAQAEELLLQSKQYVYLLKQ
jgi:hypothetical protein